MRLSDRKGLVRDFTESNRGKRGGVSKRFVKFREMGRGLKD